MAQVGKDRSPLVPLPETVVPPRASTNLHETEAEIRLSVTSRMSRTNHFSGAWWPASLDLDVELAPMLRRLATLIGPVRGVRLIRSEWLPTALDWEPRIPGRIRISWYGVQEAHTAGIVGRTADRVDLLVVPPETIRSTALVAMDRATRMGNVATAQDLLALG